MAPRVTQGSAGQVVKLDQDFGSAFSGILVDGASRLRALWASYSEQVNSEDRELCAGLQTAAFAPWARRIAAAAEAAADAPSMGPDACPVRPDSDDSSSVALRHQAQCEM